MEKQREVFEQSLIEKSAILTTDIKKANDTNIKDARNLLDLQDALIHCAAKISFVADFINQPAPGELEISKRARFGLGLFLRDIEDDIDRIADECR